VTVYRGDKGGWRVSGAGKFTGRHKTDGVILAAAGDGQPAAFFRAESTYKAPQTLCEYHRRSARPARQSAKKRHIARADSTADYATNTNAGRCPPASSFFPSIEKFTGRDVVSSPGFYGCHGANPSPSLVASLAVIAAVARVALAVTAETAKPGATLAIVTPGLALQSAAIAVSRPHHAPNRLHCRDGRRNSIVNLRKVL